MKGNTAADLDHSIQMNPIRPMSADVIDAAQRTVAANAVDAADASQLLIMLGLGATA